MGDVIHYNHAAMAAVSAQITTCGVVAFNLQQAGMLHRGTLMATFMGTAAEGGFEPAYQTFNTAMAQTIEVTSKTGTNYQAGTDALAASDASSAAIF